MSREGKLIKVTHSLGVALLTAGLSKKKVVAVRSLYVVLKSLDLWEVFSEPPYSTEPLMQYGISRETSNLWILVCKD